MIPSSADLKSIVGTWTVVESRASTSDGETLPGPFGGEHGIGRLLLDANGRMMAMMCDGRTELPVGQAREYTFYCGNYTFDGHQLVTHVDVAIDPSRIGTKQIRKVSFDGELMVLRPPLRNHRGRLEQHELVFERISDE